MATLQAAVSAVTGISWKASSPTVPTIGAAWDDGDRLRVIVAVADAAVSLGPVAVPPSVAAVTSALAAVSGYSGSTASPADWQTFPGRRAQVVTWISTSSPSLDTSVPASEPFVTAAVADEAAARAAADTAEAAARAAAIAAQHAADLRTYAAQSGSLGYRFREASAKAHSRNSVILGPMAVPPTITTSTSAIDASASQFLTAYTGAADLARLRVTGGITGVFASAYICAYTVTRPAGSGGNFPPNSAKDGYQWSTEFMCDAPRIQVQYLNGSNRFQVEVDDQPVSAAPLASPGGGGTAYTLLDFTVGSATIVASTGVFTVTPPTGTSGHGLAVGDQVYLGPITTTTGVSANVTYWVKTVPDAVTFTLSATPTGAALSLTTDGSTTSVSVVKNRKIRFEFGSGAQGFRAINIAPTFRIWAPADEHNIRVCTVGDSIDAATGSTVPNGSWQKLAGKLLGWTDVRQVSFGGTGFTNNATTLNTFGDAVRVADVVAHNPDLLIIQASQNDDANNAGLQAAALAAFQAYRTALPTTPIVVLGVDASSTGPSAARILTETTTKAAFDQWADSRSWWIPVTPDAATSWENGTGTTASKAGSGNRDRFGYDASHPNDAGHTYIARRFVAAFRGLVLPTLR